MSGMGWPRVSVAVAVSWLVAAAASVTALGDATSGVMMELDAGGQVINVAGRLLTPFKVAKMVETPGCLAVAKPFASTVAMAVLVMLQNGVPAVEVMSTPAEFRAIAENCLVVASEVHATAGAEIVRLAMRG